MLKQPERERRNVNDLFYFLAEGSVADVETAGKRKQKCE